MRIDDLNMNVLSMKFTQSWVPNIPKLQIAASLAQPVAWHERNQDRQGSLSFEKPQGPSEGPPLYLQH